MIPYSQKIDERPIGQELLITGESHIVGIVGVATVEPNMVKLVEVPLQSTPTSTVSISGYTETTNPSPGVGFFYVDYVNGYITFNSSANGLTVHVTYYGRGSEIDAVDINELQGPVGVALTIDGAVTPVSLASDPLTPQIGQIYFNNTSRQWVGWNGISWVLLG